MTITGWIYTDSTTNIKCPKCKQNKGLDCKTPKGRKRFVPHDERVREFVSLKEYSESNYCRNIIKEFKCQ